MSLFDVLGSRAQRTIADARHNVAKVGRTIVTFSGSKIVFTASPTLDGQKQLTTAGSNGNGASSASPTNGASVSNGAAKKTISVPAAPPAAASKPAAKPAPEPPAPVTATSVATVAAAPPPAPATAATSSAPLQSTARAPKPPPILRPTSIPNMNSVARASQPIFGPPVEPDHNSPPTVRREWRRRNPDRLLQAADRLNWIAAAVVVIGLLNVAGLYYALHLTGNALNVAQNVTSNQTAAVKTEQRAWIAPGAISLQTPFDKNHVGMTIALNNTGKTPATIDGVDIAIDAYDPRSNRRSQLLERHIPSRTLAPNSHTSLPIAELRALSDGDFRRIVNRNVRHEFIVTVRYRDIFGDAHRTNICNAIEGSASDMSYGNALPSCDPNTMD